MVKITDKPIFICGSQRSGTTLLAEILSKHSEIQILSETHCYPFFWKPMNHNQKNKPLNIKKYMKAVPEVNTILKIICSSLIDENVKVFNPYELLIQILRKFKGQNNNVSRVGEKTPSHIFYVQDILKKNPSSQLIILIRDPRAVALSEKTKFKNLNKESYSHFKMLVRWYVSMKLAFRYFNKYGEDKIHLVKFEDMINNSKDILIDVCKYLKIQFESEILNVSVINSSFKNENIETSFHKTNIDRWEKDLDNNETDYINYLLSTQLKQLNYKISEPSKKIRHKNLQTRIQKQMLVLAGSIGVIYPSIFHYFIKDKRYRKFKSW